MIILEDLGTRLYSKKMKRFYRVMCPTCENEFETIAYNLSKKNPMKTCRSCTSKKHATKHGGHGSPLYIKWQSMHSRVNSNSGKNFDSYGSKNIKVFDMWKDYLNFKQWSELNGYIEGLELDRIDNDGNYEPSNCRWTTRKIQCQNNRLLRSSNTSGYRGVNKVKSGKYVSRCTINNKRIHIGTFDRIEEAAIAYNNFVIENNLEHPLNKITGE